MDSTADADLALDPEWEAWRDSRASLLPSDEESVTGGRRERTDWTLLTSGLHSLVCIDGSMGGASRDAGPFCLSGVARGLFAAMRTKLHAEDLSCCVHVTVCPDGRRMVSRTSPVMAYSDGSDEGGGSFVTRLCRGCAVNPDVGMGALGGSGRPALRDLGGNPCLSVRQRVGRQAVRRKWTEPWRGG